MGVRREHRAVGTSDDRLTLGERRVWGGALAAAAALEARVSRWRARRNWVSTGSHPRPTPGARGAVALLG